MDRLGRLWREHSLTLVIVTVLTLQTSLLLWTGHYVWDHDQRTTGMVFWRWWIHEYNLSVVADVWGALFLIHSTKLFTERGSPESGDDQEDD